MWQADGLEHIHEHVIAEDPERFSELGMTKEDALFWSQPVHYHQAPRDKSEQLDLFRDTPVQGSDDSPTIIFSDRSLRTLYAYCKAVGYDDEDAASLKAFVAGEIMSISGFSQRLKTVSYAYPDWQKADERRKAAWG